MNEINWKAQYQELVKALRIHESHEHHRVLEYVRLHLDRKAAADAIIAKARDFLQEAEEQMRRTW